MHPIAHCLGRDLKTCGDFGYGQVFVLGHITMMWWDPRSDKIAKRKENAMHRNHGRDHL